MSSKAHMRQQRRRTKACAIYQHVSAQHQSNAAIYILKQYPKLCISSQI